MSLSGRSYLFVGLICLLGILGQWSVSSFLEHLWRYPAGALLFLLLLEGIRARHSKVQIHHRLTKQLSLGRQAQLKISISNPFIRSLRVETQARLPAKISAQEKLESWKIPALQTVTRHFPLVPVELGDTTPGPLFTRTLGHFGLAWWSRKLTNTTESSILPDKLTATETVAGREHFGDRQAQQQLGSGDDLIALREYRNGDALHAIDWKATAKRCQTMVRVYAREQQLQMLLVIDGGRTSRLQAGSLTRLHHYVNIAARLAQLAQLQGDHVGLLTYSNQQIDAVSLSSQLSGLHAIRAKLGDLRSQPGEFNPLGAALAARSMLRQRCLVIYLCEIEQKEAATQLAQACRTLSPKHLVMVASLVDHDIALLNNAPCDTWLSPYQRYAANEYLHSQQVTAKQLTRLGAEVVLSEHHDLDRKVLQHYRHLRQRQRV